MSVRVVLARDELRERDRRTAQQPGQDVRVPDEVVAAATIGDGAHRFGLVRKLRRVPEYRVEEGVGIDPFSGDGSFDNVGDDAGEVVSGVPPRRGQIRRSFGMRSRV